MGVHLHIGKSEQKQPQRIHNKLILLGSRNVERSNSARKVQWREPTLIHGAKKLCGVVKITAVQHMHNIGVVGGHHSVNSGGIDAEPQQRRVVPSHDGGEHFRHAHGVIHRGKHFFFTPFDAPQLPRFQWRQ